MAMRIFHLERCDEPVNHQRDAFFTIHSSRLGNILGPSRRDLPEFLLLVTLTTCSPQASFLHVYPFPTLLYSI